VLGTEGLVLAVRALGILASHSDGVLSSDRLGELLATNPVVIRRLLGRLRWDGLVETRRGRAGGYALAREPERIGLGRLHRALDRRRSEQTASSTLAAALDAAEAAYVEELDRWTVAQTAR